MGARLQLMNPGRAVVALLVACGGMVTATPLASADGAVFSGACTVTLTTSAAPSPTLVPGPTWITFWSSGTCVVNGSVVPLSFNGVLETTSVTGGLGCAGGMATGTGVFQVPYPGFPNPLVQITAVSTGAVLELTAYALVIRFEGSGVLLGNPIETAACPSGSSAVATWTGAFAFQDPVTPIG